MDLARARVLKIAWEAWRFRHGDDPAIVRRQQARLQDLVKYARIASPYYRRLYRDVPPVPVDLQSLPVVTKRDVMAHFDDWVTDPDITLESLKRDFLADHSLVGALYRGRYQVATTSGTSGDPAILVHDADAWAVYQFVGQRGEMRFIARRRFLLGIARHGFRAAALFVSDGHIGGSVALESARRSSSFLAKRLHMFSVLRSVGELVDELNAFRPTVLAGYPTALAVMSAEQKVGRLKIEPVLAITAGEDLTAALRCDIESTFSCMIQNRYASAEVPALSIQCAEGRFHISTDWYIVEPVDEHYQPVAPGVPSHTVLVTNLANRVQPLIRYDLGDRVMLAASPCACGNQFPAITLEGRTGDLLTFESADGDMVTVLPLALGTVIEETPGVRRFQAIRTDPGTVTVRLEAWPDADREEVWAAVGNRLHEFLKAQGAESVAVKRSADTPAVDPRSGKFRQVWSA